MYFAELNDFLNFSNYLDKEIRLINKISRRFKKIEGKSHSPLYSRFTVTPCKYRADTPLRTPQNHGEPVDCARTITIAEGGCEKGLTVSLRLSRTASSFSISP